MNSEQIMALIIIIVSFLVGIIIGKYILSEMNFIDWLDIKEWGLELIKAGMFMITIILLTGIVIGIIYYGFYYPNHINTNNILKLTLQVK